MIPTIPPTFEALAAETRTSRKPMGRQAKLKAACSPGVLSLCGQPLDTYGQRLGVATRRAARGALVAFEVKRRADAWQDGLALGKTTAAGSVA